MEIVILAAAAFLAAILTFFSGFGLGTILAPVFMIFFPVDVAIALTGVVHLFNNILVLFLVGKNTNRQVLIRFGIPAIAASFAGALLLIRVSNLPALFSYSFNGTLFTTSPVKFIIAILLIAFTLFDLIPTFSKTEFGKKLWPVGGLLSGFFGGLSGHQGALRSAFLIRSGLTKEAFIASAAALSILVDFTRLTVYSTSFLKAGLQNSPKFVIAAIIAASVGSLIGKRLLKKVTFKFVRVTVAVMLFSIAVALAMGFI